MSSVEDKINKLREERMAREKARIEKLRELNLKKYNKPDSLVPKNFINKAPSTKSLPKTEQTTSGISKVKNMSHLNLTSKRPFTAPFPLAKKINKEVMLKPMTAVVKPNQSETKIAKIKPFCGDIKKIEGDNKSATIKPTTSKTNSETVKANTNVTLKPSGKESKMPRPIPNTRKSLAPPSTVRQALQPLTRKSMLPTSTINPKKPNANWESVFDRLYKPKTMQTNAEPIKKVLVRKSLKPIESKPKTLPIRRSISAVHFKKVNKSELKNCFHKWASIGDQLNDAHMNEIVEENGSNEQIVCAIKSERKKVKFSTSILQNTPKPEELQERLQKWLLKRGKSLESFHHLQCFGIHHLSKPIRPLQFEDARDLDEENKENQPVESDSDNESFTDNTNDRAGDFKDKSSFAADKWRRTSIANSSLAELNDTTTSTLSQSLSSAVQSDELLVGALTDLTELIKEGFDWNQCAHWLSAVRKRCPNAGSTAAYWECRAALEERRGNLPLSVHCWEEAIVNGTEQTVVEANLDHLLDKFMQLNISTNDKSKQVDPKLVDVKNVFKSTIIRFAVQQAKLRQANAVSPRFTVTPVRRSGRLSVRERSTVKRSPLRICASVRQAQKFADKAVFIPNPALVHTP